MVACVGVETRPKPMSACIQEKPPRLEYLLRRLFLSRPSAQPLQPSRTKGQEISPLPAQRDHREVSVLDTNAAKYYARAAPRHNSVAVSKAGGTLKVRPLARRPVVCLLPAQEAARGTVASSLPLRRFPHSRSPFHHLRHRCCFGHLPTAHMHRRETMT